MTAQIYHIQKKGEEVDNENDEGETKETEPKDHDACTSSGGVVELTCIFQSQNEVETYATKYMANNNKQAKVIVKLQDNTELNVTKILLQKTRDANEGGNNLLFK